MSLKTVLAQSTHYIFECLQSVVLITTQTCQHVIMPKHAANMLKVYAKGLLKTKTTQGFKTKENERTLKETKFPHHLRLSSTSYEGCSVEKKRMAKEEFRFLKQMMMSLSLREPRDAPRTACRHLVFLEPKSSTSWISFTESMPSARLESTDNNQYKIHTKTT